jgi:uncharacterized protein YhbP (UPF0306 family)
VTAYTPGPDVPADVLAYLDSQHTLTLASVSPTGVPHATTVVYVNRGIVFFVCTRRGSPTVEHVARNPAVAFTIDQYNPDWNKAKGIQGLGEAMTISSPEEIELAALRFQDKFPSLVSVDTSNLVFFCITPTSMQFIDNEQRVRDEPDHRVGPDFERSVVFNVFRDLPPQELDEVSGAMETMEVAAGEVIVRQGDPAERFFIVVAGEVEVTREESGNQVVVAHLHRGQFFGEMAVLMNVMRNATVTAVVDTTLLSMERTAFRSLVAQSLSTTSDFDQLVEHRLANLARLASS